MMPRRAPPGSASGRALARASALAALLALALAPGSAPAETPAVADDRVDAEAPAPTALVLEGALAPLDPTLRAALEPYVGLPARLDDAGLAEAERWLLDTTLFARVRCEARGTSTVACALLPRTLVVDATLGGSLPFSMLPADLERRTFVRRGVLVDTPTIALAKQTDRLLRSLRDDGYLGARVRTEPAPAPAPAPLLGVQVHIDVDTGPTATLGEITVDGPPLLTDDELDLFREFWLFRAAPARFRPARFEEALDGAAASLRARGWPAARLTGRWRHDPARQVVDVALTLDPGPRVELAFVGASTLDADALRGVATFAEAGSIEASEIERTRRAMIDAYQREGHYAPTIEAETRAIDGGAIELRFTIDEGPRAFVRERVIRALGDVDDGAILDGLELYTRPRGLLVSGAWVDAWVAHDEGVITDALVRAGYASATVHAERLEDARTGELVAVFVVDEGPRRSVGPVAVRGLPPEVDEAALRARLALQPGRPFVEAELGPDRRLILGALAEAGYPHAELGRRLKQPYRDQPGDVTLTYTVEPGPRARYAGVLLVGNVRTADDVLLDQLQLEVGEPLVASRLVAARQRLRGLGAFGNVELRPLAPTRTATDTWLLAAVEERDRRQLFLALTFSTNEFFSVGADFSDLNLFGRAASLALEARFANASELGTPLKIGQRDRAQLRLRAPRPLGAPFDVEATLLYDLLNRPDIFVERRVGAQLALVRTLARRGEGWLRPLVTASLVYELTATETQIVDTTIVGNDRPATIGRLIPRLALDARDQILNPRSGWELQASLELAPAFLAGPFAGSAGNFWRFLTQARAYVTLGAPLSLRLDSGRTLGGPFVLALALAYGLAHPLGAGPRDGAAVPLSETFAYGGDLSLRGLGEGASRLAYPGAVYSLVAGAELRWVVLEAGFGAIELAGFADVGAVGAHLRTLFDATTLSLGPSLRWVTPIGPLSIAYGWPIVLPPELEARAGDQASRAGRLHVVFGARF